jgi:hypothetical protein
MADPGVTYRVQGELTMGDANSDGQIQAHVSTYHDVAGGDFAGFVRLRGSALPGGAADDYHAVVIDGTTHVWGTSRPEWLSAATPDSVRRANPFVELDAADFVLIGQTDGGHLQYSVTPWIGGDPIGEWADIGLFDGGSLAATSVQAHTTRLIVDNDGVPIRLASSWTFTSDEDGTVGDGSYVANYSAFGLYVNATAPRPDGIPPDWSHDIIVGVDEAHRTITRPFVELLPPAVGSAELRIGFRRPERPLMLGVEGAIAFLRSHAPGGELAMERVVSWDGEAVDIPSGPMTLIVAYRTCDGSCALLDPNVDICSVDAEIQRGAHYELSVRIMTAQRAACELEQGSD